MAHDRQLDNTDDEQSNEHMPNQAYQPQITAELRNFVNGLAEENRAFNFEHDLFFGDIDPALMGQAARVLATDDHDTADEPDAIQIGW